MTKNSMKIFTAKIDDNNKRIDIVLSKALVLPRAEIQRWIKNGDVQLNRRSITSHSLVSEGDKISYNPKIKTAKRPAIIQSLRVLYEDEHVLVVFKPSGLLVHATNEHETSSTLADSVKAYFPKIVSVGENPLRPGIVHRLDKDVSGVMVVAKTNEAFNDLKRQFSNREVEKEYIALAYGALPKDHDVISLKIARSKARKRMVARPQSQEGKEAITEYDVLKRFKTATFVRVRIYTGRTHQIRAHFKGIDHPLVGDALYAKKHMRHIKPIAFPRVFLHAAKISFTLPNRTRKTVEAPIPKELTDLLKTLTPA